MFYQSITTIQTLTHMHAHTSVTHLIKNLSLQNEYLTFGTHRIGVEGQRPYGVQLGHCVVMKTDPPVSPNQLYNITVQQERQKKNIV